MRLKFVAPLMPTLVEKPPEGDAWIHEVKFDGYRSQLIIDEDRTRIYTRNGHDWTAKYSDLVQEAKGLGAESAIIDGEIIVTNEDGLSDFRPLRKAITSRQHHLYFVAFDLLHLNGFDLRDMALKDRRAGLYAIIPTGLRIQFSDALPGDAKAIFELVDKAGLEGMVSKRKDSKYRSGKSTTWLKIKAYTIDEYELLGVECEAGKPAFALMADRNTGRYVGFHQFEPGYPRAAVEACPGACRAGPEGPEAAGDAMGQARHHRPCEAPTGRGRPPPRFVAGFP